MHKILRTQQISLISVVVVSIVVTPWSSYDPINISKFLILSTASMGMAGLILKLRIWENRALRVPLLMYALFVLQILLVLAVTRVNFIEQIFGSSGRNTGALTYFYFAVISTLALYLSNKDFLPKILNALIFAGSIDGIYGLVQTIGMDPINWTNPYSPVFGFFGNPNFHSSFMALVGIVAMMKCLNKNMLLGRRVAYAALLLLTIINIWQSNSIQGFLVLATGISVLYLAFLKFKKTNNLFKVLLSTFPFFAAVAAMLDIFQKSPWKPILYQESISSRGDYWHAGWEMTKSNPLFGVGFDNYGDNYRKFRSLTSVQERGVEIVSNSAHNIFLDISSNGGFILLILYASLIVLALRSIYRFSKSAEKFDPVFFTIVALWFGFQAQSIISVNQIGLGIWGWFLTATIIGYELNSTNLSKEKVLGKNSYSDKHSNFAYISGLIIGFTIGILPFRADSNYRSAGTELTQDKLTQVTYAWPRDTQRMLSAAYTFRDNALPKESLKVAKDIIEINKNKYLAWQLIYFNEFSTMKEKQFALKEMKILDPYNPSNNL
jgi:O-antigen ligase